MKLDIFDFCTSDLQQKTIPIRSHFKSVEDKKLVRWDCFSFSPLLSLVIFPFVPQAIKAKRIAEGISIGQQQLDKPPEYESYSFDNGECYYMGAHVCMCVWRTGHEAIISPSDAGSNNSGYYELLAVLTHKGRSSSSGHYLAWVRRRKGTCVNAVVTFPCSNSCFNNHLSRFSTRVEAQMILNCKWSKMDM